MPQADQAALVARRAREAPPRAGGCRIVAIDGPSGSGKTTLAAAVVAQLAVAGGPSVPVVAMDDLIPGWDGLRAGPDIVLRDVVQPIAAGRDGGYRRYDWHRKQYAEWQAVPLAPFLVIEGCGSGAAALGPYLALLVWVEADRDVRFDRGMARDGETFRPYWTAWEAESQQLFADERTRERADVIVNGNEEPPTSG